MNTEPNPINRKSLDLNWREIGAHKARSIDDVLHVAEPTEATWELWRAHKDAMRGFGFRMSKGIQGWEIQWRAANEVATAGMIIMEARCALFDYLQGK